MQQQINAQHLAQSKPVTCDECGHDVFDQKMMMRRISKLLIAEDKDQIIPIPVIVCAKCGHINEDSKPKFPND